MVGGYATTTDAEHIECAKKALHAVKAEAFPTVGLAATADFNVDDVAIQVVAGLNYKVTFSVGDNKYEAVIYRNLQNTHSLTSVAKK
jgi:hypothetical protein